MNPKTQSIQTTRLGYRMDPLIKTGAVCSPVHLFSWLDVQNTLVQLEFDELAIFSVDFDKLTHFNWYLLAWHGTKAKQQRQLQFTIYILISNWLCRVYSMKSILAKWHLDNNNCQCIDVTDSTAGKNNFIENQGQWYQTNLFRLSESKKTTIVQLVCTRLFVGFCAPASKIS